MDDDARKPTTTIEIDPVEIAQLVWDEARAEGVKGSKAGWEADDCPYAGGVQMMAWLDGWGNS